MYNTARAILDDKRGQRVVGELTDGYTPSSETRDIISLLCKIGPFPSWHITCWQRSAFLVRENCQASEDEKLMDDELIGQMTYARTILPLRYEHEHSSFQESWFLVPKIPPRLLSAEHYTSSHCIQMFKAKYGLRYGVPWLYLVSITSAMTNWRRYRGWMPLLERLCDCMHGLPTCSSVSVWLLSKVPACTICPPIVRSFAKMVSLHADRVEYYTAQNKKERFPCRSLSKIATCLYLKQSLSQSLQGPPFS